MSKLGFGLLSVILVGTEVVASHAATATQIYSQRSGSIFDRSATNVQLHSIALAKKCTIKRYRRPH
jgi:hypothetical protein